MIDERGLGDDSLVIELASNDGYLLQHYRDAGVPVLGVDPARNIAAAAEARGIPTRCAFFGRELAQELVAEGLRPDLLHANNVLAHVPDLNGFVAGIAELLGAGGGRGVIEVPYVKDLLDGVEFDTIYHEHLCYFSLTALGGLFTRHGLVVEAIERLEIHGGSLRVFIAPEGIAEQAGSVELLIEEEAGWGVGRPEPYLAFGERVVAMGERLKGLARRPEVGGSPARRLRRGGEGEHAAEHLRDRRSRRSTSSPTPARTSRGATCRAAGSRSPPRAAARGEAGLRAAAGVELRRRDPRAAGRLPEPGRAVHHPDSRAEGRMTIEGVQVIPLRRIPDERGTIFHMLRADDPHFTEFGEIYFASVYEGVVKAWHLHRLMTLNYACVHGRVKVVCYDDRAESPTRGNLMEVFLGPDNYSLIVIPPGIWNGHKGMGPGRLDHRQLRDPSPRSVAVRATRPVRQRDPVRLGCPSPLKAGGALPSAIVPNRTLLVFHAERLHDDSVWRRVLPVATALAEGGIRLTFFVFPYRAEAVGADLARSRARAEALGHEVGQHTHFYAGKSFLTEHKSDDFSDGNVVACLERDADALRAMGVKLRGFTAGAWQLPDAALNALLDLGFEYDCLCPPSAAWRPAPQRAPSVARPA